WGTPFRESNPTHWRTAQRVAFALGLPRPLVAMALGPDGTAGGAPRGWVFVPVDDWRSYSLGWNWLTATEALGAAVWSRREPGAVLVDPQAIRDAQQEIAGRASSPGDFPGLVEERPDLSWWYFTARAQGVKVPRPPAPRRAPRGRPASG